MGGRIMIIGGAAILANHKTGVAVGPLEGSPTLWTLESQVKG